MKLIKLTQEQFAQVDDEDFDRIVAMGPWYYSKRHGAAKNVHGYVDGKYKKIGSLLMHRVILEAPKGMEVDHINGLNIQNQRSNLRLATHHQNMMNTKLRKTSLSRLKGVSLYRKDHWTKWRARIMVNQKEIALGYFDTKEEASKAYNEAAKKYFGEFAKLNDI